VLKMSYFHRLLSVSYLYNIYFLECHKGPKKTARRLGMSPDGR
jgi:hypothetical protein